MRVARRFTFVIVSPSLCHSERSEESGIPLRINSAKNLSLRGRIIHRTDIPFAALSNCLACQDVEHICQGI